MRVDYIALILSLLCGIATLRAPQVSAERDNIAETEPAQTAGADLVISGIAPSAVAPPKVFVFVQNQGDTVVRSDFDVELWLDDQWLGRQQVTQPVEAFSKHSVMLTFMRPMTMEKGLHTFMAKVDTGNAVHEAVKLNNVGYSSIWFDDSETQVSQTTERGR